jgi:hypothetical protein
MCLKIRCDGKSTIFLQNFLDLNWSIASLFDACLRAASEDVVGSARLYARLHYEPKLAAPLRLQQAAAKSPSRLMPLVDTRPSSDGSFHGNSVHTVFMQFFPHGVPAPATNRMQDLIWCQAGWPHAAVGTNTRNESAWRIEPLAPCQPVHSDSTD